MPNVQHKIMVTQAANFKTSIAHTEGLLNTLNSSITSTRIVELQLRVASCTSNLDSIHNAPREICGLYK